MKNNNRLINKPLPVGYKQLFESIERDSKMRKSRRINEDDTKIDDKAAEETAKELGSAIKNAEDKVENILKNIKIDNEDELEKEFASIAEALGVKGNKFTLKEQYGRKRLNEGFLGLILSSPKIMELVGKGLKSLGGLVNIVVKKVTGKTLDNNMVQKLGELLEKGGHKIHHFMTDVIGDMAAQVVSDLTGGKSKMDEKKKEQFAKVVLFTTIAVLFVTGSPEVIEKLLKFSSDSIMPAIMQAIKAGELMEMGKVKDLIGKVVAGVMIVFGLKMAADAKPEKKKDFENVLNNVKLA
jgi:hypothetical protein